MFQKHRWAIKDILWEFIFKIIKMLNMDFLTQMTLLKYCKNAIGRILLIKIIFYCSPVSRNESHNAKRKRQRGIIFQELLFHSSLAHIFEWTYKEKREGYASKHKNLVLRGFMSCASMGKPNHVMSVALEGNIINSKS